jgi:prephenate dehydratase
MMAVNELGYGILPIENTLEGYMQHHLDLLLEYDLIIEAELDLPIAFSLIGHVPSKQMKTLYVQYSAKNQCMQFLRQHPSLKVVVSESNGESYQLFQNDSSSAAIIPRHIYETIDHPYGIANVADETQNFTRFLIVRTNKDLPLSFEEITRVKVSFVIIPTHDRPGLLFDILKVFAENQINLVSIMSRPTKKEMGNYYFFLELEGNAEHLPFIQKVLDELGRHYKIRTLGIYQNITNSENKTN